MPPSILRSVEATNANCPKKEKRFLGVLECKFHAYGQSLGIYAPNRQGLAEAHDNH